MNKILIAVVKDHAKRNYNNYGWSEVVECYDDKDIAEIIGDATTSNEAINRMEKVVGVRNERYREAVGADIKCPDCGTYYPLELICPKCR